eukprot:2756560-Prymnesium_polylepis.2
MSDLPPSARPLAITQTSRRGRPFDLPAPRRDNATLLEDFVNKMAQGCLRPDGICIKMKTATGRNTP